MGEGGYPDLNREQTVPHTVALPLSYIHLETLACHKHKHGSYSFRPCYLAILLSCYFPPMFHLLRYFPPPCFNVMGGSYCGGGCFSEGKRNATSTQNDATSGG